MANFNRVILMGNLTRDPELANTPNGTSICKFGIAVNRKFKERESTMFIDCTTWGKIGELIHQYSRKGDPIMIEGWLEFHSWEDKSSGQRRSKHSMTVENFQFLGGKPAGDSQRQSSRGALSADDVPF